MEGDLACSHIGSGASSGAEELWRPHVQMALAPRNTYMAASLPPLRAFPSRENRMAQEGEAGNPDPLIPSDLMFDPWATCTGFHLLLIATKVTESLLDANLKRAGRHLRRPKAEVVERVSNIISSLVANLALLHRGELHGRRLAIKMEHTAATRYDRSGFGQLPKVIGAMADLGLIVKHRAVTHKRRTGIEATGWLLEALKVNEVSIGQVGKAEGEETVWLTARTGRDAYGNKPPNELVNYEDTDETCRLRMEMEEINRFLSLQRIELDGEAQASITLTRRFLLRHPNDRPAFNLHGRLYGAFWLTLPQHRREGLRINGEPIADLDFASMFPRLAYGVAGSEPPEGDLYAIPGLEGHREGVKAGLSALLSTPSEMSRLPSNVKAKLPLGWTAARFREAIALKHAALVPLFGRDLAMDLMFTESQILVQALLRLMMQGVPALPMHDGMMVAGRHVCTAMHAMEWAAERVVRRRIPVTLKSSMR